MPLVNISIYPMCCPCLNPPSLISLLQVTTMKMHLFTLIQMVCLGALWMVKMSAFSLALPFVLILTIPLRMAITGTLFTDKEMKCVSGTHMF